MLHEYSGPAQRFVLERLDLLVYRLGQLGHQVRDTVARIVGTTVAEAVSESLARIVRRWPRHTPSPSRHPYWRDPDPHDPYDDDSTVDPYAAEPEESLPSPEPYWLHRFSRSATVHAAIHGVRQLGLPILARQLLLGSLAGLVFLAWWYRPRPVPAPND